MSRSVEKTPRNKQGKLSKKGAKVARAVQYFGRLMHTRGKVSKKKKKKSKRKER